MEQPTPHPEVPNAPQQRTRFTDAQKATLKEYQERGMTRSGTLFEECVALLGIDAGKVKNWLSNHRLGPTNVRLRASETLPDPSALPPVMPPVPSPSLPSNILYKPAKNRGPSIRDAFQRLAGDQLRAEGTLKGVRGGAAQINARAAEIATTMDGEGRRVLEDSVMHAKANYDTEEKRRMSEKEREDLIRHHCRNLRTHAAALAQLGASTLLVQYFPDEQQGKGLFETGQHGDMASTIQACVEDAAGVSLDVILGGSLLNARKRSRTGGAVRDENVEMLRKQAREKMLQSINNFLSASGKPLRVDLPSMELERRCPFFLAGWPDITVRPSAMRMHAARQVLEMETITIEACKGCERCGTVCAGI